MTRIKNKKTNNKVLKQKTKIKYDFVDEQINFGRLIYFIEVSEMKR